ncbi:Voltage-gated Ion Channel (VIC) Superfamily [Phytophthora cinnamomi]|uniref:Voltage-gated Ion Channel (VIC) Superfamily n=1 Tax=Phytophthora cinnamomi TaxID=4785 RepID=UPI00355A3585|nr:Voltage-gated Ion Channel (VIC) Superfamily [Phytophthora cinnamomi]
MPASRLRSLSVPAILDEIIIRPSRRARDPQAASFKVWHQVLLVSLLYEFATIPFIITFQPSVPLCDNAAAIVFYVVEFLFLVDFYVKFTTGFYKDGNLVNDIRVTHARYLKSREFAVDLFAIIPFSTLPVRLSTSTMVLEVHKVLRVYRVPRYLSTVEDVYVRHFELLKLSKLLVGVVLLSHYIACIRFSFGYDDHHNNDWLPSPPEHAATTRTQYLMSMFWAFGLLTGLFEGELPHNINEFCFTIAVAICGFSVFTSLCATFFLISKCEATNSEVSEARITQLKHILTFHRVPDHVRDPIIEYLRHYYTGTDTIDREVTKLLCPSIGKDVQIELLRGVIAKITVFSSSSNTGELPQTASQCLLTIITLIIGFFLFAYVIGNFTDIIELSNAEHREFNTKLGSIRRLLVHFKLPTGLQNKIKTLLFFKRFHSITQEEVLERWLPPPLMTDIRLLNLNPMIEKVPFLKGMNASITRMLVAQFKQELMLKEEYVYRFGDDGTDMYFVFRGVLSMFTPKRKGALGDSCRSEGILEFARMRPLQKVNDISAGDFFGENALFADAPRTCSVRCKSSCILYSLSRHSLEMVFDLFPEWKTYVLQTAKLQQKEMKQRGNSITTLVRSFNSSPGLKPIEIAQPPTGNIQGAFVSPGSWWCSLNWISSLSAVLETQSPEHIIWLRIVTASTFYVAFMLPSCVAFDACRAWSGLSLGANTLEVLSFIVFVVDIWVNLRLKQTELEMELYEVDIRKSYRHNRLAVDIIAALPIKYLFYMFSPPTEVAWLSVNRCVKVLNVAHYMNEIHRQSVSYESGRLQTISLLYMLVIYWGACVYLMFADLEGYSTEWNSWFPSTELDTDENSPLSILYLRFLRGLFFAVTAFIKKGRTFMPEGNGFMFADIVCFLGLMVMAFMVGELASLFISSIDNEVNYRKNHIAVEHTIARWKVSPALNARVHVFLSNLWSSHRGVAYQEVFSTLPPQIRRETVLYIVELPLQALIFKVFRPLAQGDGPSLTRLTQAIADQLRFDSYPSREYVLQEERMPEGVFFVVSGHLLATTKTRGPDQPVAQYTRGDYFGERAILTHSMSNTSVQTQMPCDLFLLSTHSLISILSADEFFSIVQIAVEGLFHALQRQQSKQGGPSPFPMTPSVWEQYLRKVFQRQQLKWALSSNFSDGDSSSASKGEVLWNKLLTSILDNSDATLSCFQAFRPFLEMAGPKGELFDRRVPLRRVANGLANSRKKPGENFRSLARQIGIAAISTKNRVIPMLHGSTPSSASRASSVSRGKDRSSRWFTERSQRIHDQPSGA